MATGDTRVTCKNSIVTLALVTLYLSPGSAWGVERLSFKPGFNLFSPQQDVQVGREASTEAEKQMPLVTDPAVVHYVNDLGGRLASFAPNNQGYAWTFKVVNSGDINAFALPG